MMNSGRTYYRGRDSQNPNMINNDGTGGGHPPSMNMNQPETPMPTSLHVTPMDAEVFGQGGGHHPSMNMNQTETPMPTSLRVTPMDAEVFGQEIHDKFQELEIPSTQVPRDYVPNVKSVDDLFMEDERSSANYATTIADDDVIHVEGTIDDRVTIDKWTDATFAEPLMNNIKRANYVMPRAIQKTAIPLILDNYDVLGHAETGSGKTAAYLIPIISECIDAKASGKFKSESGHPYCIILTPTRELVRQCFEQACKFSNETGVTVAKSYGDYPTRKNKEEINRGCDILCITPGRFKHFADDGSIAFNKLRFFVLDEGDHLLSANFLNDIRPIMELPS
uniref:ATP-dependent RNA helicase n=1 Tax=Panagrolaimus sp. ES5 TaxID=591445 RepID=A0AC34F970_9BILA